MPKMKSMKMIITVAFNVDTNDNNNKYLYSALSFVIQNAVTQNE